MQIHWRPLFIGSLVILTALTNPAAAQTLEGPAAVVDGSKDVLIGGKPAVRTGDGTTAGDVVVEGSSNVFINGKPAVTAGDKTACGGVIVGGSASVFVNGKPLVASGDAVAPCPKK